MSSLTNERALKIARLAITVDVESRLLRAEEERGQKQQARDTRRPARINS